MAVLEGATVSLQPALLVSLAGAGRLTIEQMGYAAILEALAMAVASAITGARLPPDRLRLVARIAAMMALAANLVSFWASGYGVMALRILAGFSAGTVMLIYVGMMARVPQPARVAAFYGVGQGSLALMLSALILAVLVPRGGAAPLLRDVRRQRADAGAERGDPAAVRAHRPPWRRTAAADPARPCCADCGRAAFRGDHGAVDLRAAAGAACRPDDGVGGLRTVVGIQLQAGRPGVGCQN